MEKKILLFVSIFLLFTPFSSAYTIEGEKIATALEQLSPFMNLNTVDYTIKFDQQKAREYGVSSEYVNIGKDYEVFHNLAIESIKQRGIYDAKIDSFALTKFEPFFLFVAETGLMHKKSLTTTPIDITGTAPFIPVIKQKGTTQNTRNKNSFTDVCGGSQDHPHRCPARVASGVYRTSRTAISSYLRGRGFHNTYYPGCGLATYSCPGFTRWITTYGCASGIFRTEAWLTGSGTRWSYSTQTPEPNPEIGSYGWPVYWWGTYVFWWHFSYCS